MIVTPLDSAVLDSKEQYVFYHKVIDFSLKELIVAVQQKQICNKQEVQLFKQYSDLLLYSIEAMRVKYMYDDEENMKVDLTDSGFPNYLEFRYLFNDLELREEFLGRLTHVDDLKEEFLDTLMRKKEPIAKRKLFQAASIVYYTSAKKEYIFNRFVQGKIIPSPEDVSVAEHLVSWSFYDVTHNRPFICFMYFDYDGRDVQDYKDEIYTVLKNTSDREMAMETMAYAIDKRLPKVMPKLIKRVDLGPIHNVFAKDENEVTHAILEGIAKKTIPLESYAISFKIDEITSKSEFKEGGFFSKQIFQRWDTAYRQRFLLAPHRIIQLLYNKTPDIMNTLAQAPIQIADLKMEN